MDFPAHRRLVGALLFAGLWIALALARPTTTFHLAPLIVAIWPPLAEREPRRSAAMAASSLSLAMGATLLLSLGGGLQGPSMLPWGGPALESAVASVLGALLGTLPSLVGRARRTGD